MPEFYPFILFRVLRHRIQIQSIRFVSGSLALRPDSITLFFFRVLGNHAQIQSLCFDSGSLASRLDSISSFCFRFSGIAPKFNPFVLIQVLWHSPRLYPFVLILVLGHRARILSLCFDSSSLALCPDLIPSFCFVFFGIVPRFDQFFFFRVLRYRAWIRSFFYFRFSSIASKHRLSFSASRPAFSSSSLASCPRITYLFRHRVQISPIFIGIVFEHRLSVSASHPAFSYLFKNRVR